MNGQDWVVTTNNGNGVNVNSDSGFLDLVDDGADGDRFATFAGRINTGNGSPSNSSQIDQTGIEIDPAGIGQEHTLSFSVAWNQVADRTDDEVAISAWVFDGEDSSELAMTRYVHGTPSTSPGDNNWERTSLTFTPTSSTINLRFQETTINSDLSDTMLDHVTLTYTPVTNNNILSPSFEQKDEDGVGGQDWTVTNNNGTGVNVSDAEGAADKINDGADGDRFATFLGTMNTGNGSPSNGAQIDQTGIAIDPAGIGQEHTLSFSVAWLQGVDRTSDDVAISAWVFDGGDSSELAMTRYVVQTPSTSPGDNIWERTSFTFTPNSSTIDLRFQETTPNSGASDAMLDHITLTYTPIP